MSLDNIRNEMEDDFDFSDDDVWGESVEVPKKQFMGMTPGQRFVLAFLLFLTATILAAFCLLITGRISLPI